MPAQFLYVRTLGIFLGVLCCLFVSVGCPGAGLDEPGHELLREVRSETAPDGGGREALVEETIEEKLCIADGKAQGCDEQKCNEDQECKRTCGAQSFCKLAPYWQGGQGRCVGKRTCEDCPSTCKEDKDCQVEACGQALYCNTTLKKCVPFGQLCPFTCLLDIHCPASLCGARPFCQKAVSEKTGRCQNRSAAASCPVTCTQTSDCWVEDCAKRTYCNTQLGKCVEREQVCPYSCTNDEDCDAKRCGTFSFCYINYIGQSGKCEERKSGQCPSSCDEHRDCAVSGCGDNRFCNWDTRSCTTTDKMCTDFCRTDADCIPEHCGQRKICKRAMCWPE